MSLTTYNVDAGKDRATIELSGETKVVFSFDPNIIAVEAVSGEVNVSLDEGATAGDDGCDTLSEGQSTRMNPIADKCIYVNGTGTVKVWGGRSGEDCPFPKSVKGGGGSSGDNTHYKGTTTTPINNGSTTNPITIDGEEYTAVFGDIVVYGYTEFVFDGSAWSEFGRPFDNTPTSGSANAVTSDGIYKRTPLYRSNNGGAQSGNGSSAYDTSSIAVGVYARATASASAAFGSTTSASSVAMMAIGVANKPRYGDYFEIGNGANASNRSNIVEVNSTEMNVNGDIKKNNVSLPTPYTTMPTITEAMLGQIAQYVGETTNDYVKGYFYIASSDGAAEPTYSWVSMVDSTPTSGSKNFVTSDGIYQMTPWNRGTGVSSAQKGIGCVAGGYGSIASGYQSKALASGAVAIGNYINIPANCNYLHAVGNFNNARINDIFEIGNGASNNARSNILEVNSTELNVNGTIQRDGIGIDDYTTTERKIGKWIDGSDLYQRTFEVTGIHNDGTYDDNILGTSDIVIRDWTGYIQYDIGTGKQHFPIYGYWANTTDWIGSWTTAGCNDLSIHAKLETSTYTLDKAIITIKYTKPSAQANLMQIPTPTEEVSETPTTVEEDMR